MGRKITVLRCELEQKLLDVGGRMHDLYIYARHRTYRHELVSSVFGNTWSTLSSLIGNTSNKVMLILKKDISIYVINWGEDLLYIIEPFKTSWRLVRLSNVNTVIK